MEDLIPAEQPETSSGRDCANCGQPAMKGGHPTPLCSDCREQFTRLTIPFWIKLFVGAIGVLLLCSLYTLPGNIMLGIHLHKGQKAIEQKNYNTAEQELKLVTQKTPKNVEANGNLLVAAFYNQDFEALGEEYKHLQHIKVDDEDLLGKIDFVLDKTARYMPDDSFEVFNTAHPQLTTAADTAWRNYFAGNANDCYAMMQYASVLFDKENYATCDSVIKLALNVDNEYFTALMMETSVKRELGDMDGALAIGQRMLSLNHESVLGMSTQARTLLRMKKDQPALDMALKACRLDPKRPYATATLILAYHFNGRTEDRDALLKKARSAATADSTAKADLQYALDVMDHKEKFRD
jgi:tetratricopeptide (TPR) repeat protein